MVIYDDVIYDDDDEDRYELYVRDPKTGEERLNWGVLFNWSPTKFFTGEWMLFILPFLQVHLWLKKWRRR